jgi:hypothetical protein
MRVKTSSLCTILFPLVLLCQQAERTPAKQKPEDSGFLISPTIFKDDGCARDFVKAQSLSGVEKRKALAEIAQYGCVEERTDAIYTAIVVESSTVALKTQKVKISKVVTILEGERTSQLGGDPLAASLGAEGWIIDSDLRRLDAVEFDALIAELKAKRR